MAVYQLDALTPDIADSAWVADNAQVIGDVHMAANRLLDAGACLVGKTNLDQFACGLNGTRSPFGAVPNAFDHARVSGGSSSGSAYVVATGQVDFALGTDTAGSGRVPAGFNHLVGLKPTPGRVSTAGVLPACRSLDCVSVFALTVEDAATVLAVMEGADEADDYSCFQPGPAALPARLRVGVPRTPVLDADQGKQINVLLNGQNNNMMPAWRQLSDTEIAAVITYTKNHWSNKTGQTVQPAEVMAARK